ncbi:MAG TPA: hypothetical protein VFQ16_14915 [Burkholderiaceae bacterium]|nr:hypothetical protein [Burkholderiaceae bacterium]
MIKRSVLKGLVLALALTVAGCATLPSPEAMRAAVAGFELPRSAEPDKVLVYVVRPNELGMIVRFNVFVGDQEPASEMGYTRGGQYIHFSMPPGKNRLFSKAENTAELEIDARGGEVVYLQQEPAMGLLFARNSMFRIEELPGKYLVKTLKPGTMLKPGK